MMSCRLDRLTSTVYVLDTVEMVFLCDQNCIWKCSLANISATVAGKTADFQASNDYGLKFGPHVLVILARFIFHQRVHAHFPLEWVMTWRVDRSWSSKKLFDVNFVVCESIKIRRLIFQYPFDSIRTIHNSTTEWYAKQRKSQPVISEIDYVFFIPILHANLAKFLAWSNYSKLLSASSSLTTFRCLISIFLTLRKRWKER